MMFLLTSPVMAATSRMICSDATSVLTDLIRRWSATLQASAREGWLYVASILDLCGRIPVGIAAGPSNDTKLVSAAFQDMRRRGHRGSGCILHSDRGSTYTSDDYQKLISSNNMISSMSRKGDCWDNAPMENFWGKMKFEFVDKIYDTLDDARTAI